MPAAVRAPLECEGGGAHGGVVVLVATMGTVFKGFEGASKTWSRYRPSPAFRRGSGDKNLVMHTTVRQYSQLVIRDSDRI